MNILVPLSKRENIGNLREAGANELYFGFTDEAWTSEFGDFKDINRMTGFKARANGIDINEVPSTVSDIHKSDMKAFVTVNAPEYSSQGLKFVESYLDIISAAHADGVIISEISVAKLALDRGLNVVASTMCACYNEDIVGFYVNRGVRRIILPREMSLDDIGYNVKKYPDVCFEVFLMRNGCIFSDSHCLGSHSREFGSLCGAIRHGPFAILTDNRDFKSMHEIELNNIFFNEMFRISACGLCAIYRLMHLGVGAGKIVGRADLFEQIISDVKLVKDNIRIAQNSSSEKDYLARVIFPKAHYHMCKYGVSCYYPEVRF